MSPPAPSEHPHPGYRPCVGVWLLNAQGEVFTAKRIDARQAGWQAPQGGIDPGESPIEAAVRELREETGVSDARVLAESVVWRAYDLPNAVRRKIWGGRFRGQTQRWVAMRYEGPDEAIDIAGESPEFSEWRWSDPALASRDVVHFKRSIYREVHAEFARFSTP